MVNIYDYEDIHHTVQSHFKSEYPGFKVAKAPLGVSSFTVKKGFIFKFPCTVTLSKRCRKIYTRWDFSFSCSFDITYGVNYGQRVLAYYIDNLDGKP